MKKCIICGEVMERPFVSAFSHFYLYVPGQWRFLKGNIKTFGWWDGIWSTIGLMCPCYNTIRYWKYRKYRLDIEKA